MNINMPNATTSVDRHLDRQVTEDRIRSVGNIVGHRLLNAGVFNLESALKSFSRGRPIALQSASQAAKHSLSLLVHRGDFAVSTELAKQPSLSSDLLMALVAGNAIDDKDVVLTGEQLVVDAMIYCMLQQKAPISSASDYLRAIHAVRPIAGDEIDALFEAAKPADAEAAWLEIADARGIDVGVGPWGEVRTVYTSDMFRSTLIDGARRTVHLGLDLFMPAGTKLFSPVDGIVAGVDIEPEMLSYGCLVTLIHRPANGIEFLSLWDHLAHEAASRLAAGDVVQAGDLIGSMGHHTENGGWAPHVHLQLCADTTLSPTEIIGVGEQPYMEVWAALFPPANAFAKVPVVGVPV